ncbi:MAG: hypothetical protein KDA87_22565, partial [Planctomycetales bacterium]|nr:hypothetical protein [Planctomycetales bacterium]
SSVGVILSAIFWTWLWGPVGLVLAMPLTVCLVVAGKYVPCLQFISVLIGDQGTMLSDAERYYQRLLAQDQEEAGQIVDIHQQNNDLIKTLDDVVLPALVMCERDRHAGRIDQHQADFVLDATKDYFDDQHKDNSITSDGPKHVSSLPTVLCVPARDPADELVAELCQLVLRTKGISSSVASVNQLVSEVNADISTLQPAMILISALPPHVNRHTRYWCKKIQQHHPQIRITVGVWQGQHLKRIRQQLASNGATQVVHSLTEFATAAATAHLATVGESNPSAVASLATT